LHDIFPYVFYDNNELIDLLQTKLFAKKDNLTTTVKIDKTNCHNDIIPILS